MELLKLSKFKLQLQALVTEARDLRERELAAAEQCRLLVQKQKQTEEDYARKLQELLAELASSNEVGQKLERQVSYLQSDNVLLENKQKELNGTIQTLLQARESFLNAYQESTCEMKRSIQARDRRLGLLSEKINSHLSLFDSIEKEAFFIKQAVDNVQRLVTEKEGVVAGLRSKMEQVSTFETLFIERINGLENKLKNYEDEFRRKDRIISELETQLEEAKIGNNQHSQIEELQKTLLAKDVVIQNLISEKEALHHEVGSLAMILHKIQETLSNMNEEDKRAFSSKLEYKEECDTTMTNEDKNRIEDKVQNREETRPSNTSNLDTAENKASLTGQERSSVSNPVKENNHSYSSVSEASRLVIASEELTNCANVVKFKLTGLFHVTVPLLWLPSPSAELQSASIPSILMNTGKIDCITQVNHLDSECSTSQKIQVNQMGTN